MPNAFQTLRVPQFARATDYAGVWAIDPMHGASLWEMAQRIDLAAHVREAIPPTIKAEVHAEQVGKQSIAVVMLTGPLMKAASSMSGGTSTVQARREIRNAMNDPNISAIMLAIDSPGGTVSGTADLAEEVRQANKVKPVYAFIDDLGASAAYWVASQAEKIFANTDTAQIGSIGTLAVVYDLSAMAEKEGVKALVFGTGPLKGAGTPGAAVTEEQQEYFREMVNGMQESFDAGVSKGRGLSTKQLADAKTGGVFRATEAVDRKLIDGIKSFDGAMSDLAAEARRRGRDNSTRATAKVPVRSVNMDEQLDTAAAAAIDPIEAINIATAANYERIAGIQRVAADHPAIAAQAIREKWSVDKTELAAMRASLANNVMPNSPNVNVGAGKWSMGREAAPGVAVSEALEAGMMMSLGRNVEKIFRPEVCQAARESFRDIGLQGAVMLAAVQNGYPGRPGERITKSNFQQVIRSAKNMDSSFNPMATSSSISMSGILGAVANKEIVAGYMEEDTGWREIAAIRSVSNFQQVTTYRMLDDMEFEELGADGKIKHGTAGQESYTRQAKTYAKMFSISRTNIINDDLGAFDDVRARIGRGQGKKLNKVFWTAFMSNLGTTFTSGRTNYISGSTTNLGTDGVGLGLGVKAFRTMTSPGGAAPLSADGSKRINANTQNLGGANPGGRPEILLVSPELEGNAEVLFRNQNLGAVAGSSANIHQNKYRPIVAWQLSNSGYTGYSTTQWFLLNNPAYLASMVVSFLNGQQTPTVEEENGDFDELCYLYRAYGDFGCDVAEYLAGVHSKGAA